MSTDSSFSDLLAIHRELDEVFLLHQEALVALDFVLARELLSAYRELLALHMRHEEETVLGVFARAGAVEKWPSVLFLGQHEKMRGMLEKVEAMLRDLVESSPERPRRAVLAVLELETTYKHLGEHHDGAERDGLFPTCDAVCPGEERSALVARLLDEWRAARRARQASLERARGRLDSK